MLVSLNKIIGFKTWKLEVVKLIGEACHFIDLCVYLNWFTTLKLVIYFEQQNTLQYLLSPKNNDNASILFF